LEYLSEIKKAPLPKSIKSFDEDLWDLLSTKLLVCSKHQRKTLAQCMQHPYIKAASREEPKGGVCEAPDKKLIQRFRLDDLSEGRPLHQGMLWKLNQHASPQDPAAWLQRDMWITNGASLSYYSQRDLKRLILIDAAKLCGAWITEVPDAAKKYAFEVHTKHDDDENNAPCYMFACESAEQYEQWTTKLLSLASLEMLMTVRLGADVAADLSLFKVQARNRRKKVEGLGDKAEFQPIFKSMLWKVKVGGDAKNPQDWFLRDMWLTTNGSFMYWSKREEQELMYYNAEDISCAKISCIPDGDAYHQHAFRIELQSSEAVSFAPGEFAAENDAVLQQWLREFSKFTQS